MHEEKTKIKNKFDEFLKNGVFDFNRFNCNTEYISACKHI